MRVFTVPGRIPFDELREQIERVSDPPEIYGAMVTGRRARTDWHPQKTGIPIWRTDSLADFDKRSPRTPFHTSDYDRILNQICGDPRTTYIAQRTLCSVDFNNAFNNQVNCEIACWNSLAILSACKPDVVAMKETPHNLYTWILARTAELKGIPVVMTANSPLPSRTWPVEGIDEQTPIPVTSHECQQTNGQESDITQFIHSLQGNYENAMPEYERTRMIRYRGRFWSWQRELQKACCWRPTPFLTNLAAIRRKRRLLRTYNHLSSRFARPASYLVFYLHYQPERTSFPEGYGFAQQWFAIRLLSAVLDQYGVSLVVKEHPSTFRQVDHRQMYRSPWFYEAIDSLPNASLAPLDADPFAILDNSLGVATLRGTVGMEAICRGKPVIAFGAASYKGLKGVYCAGTLQEVNAAVEAILNHPCIASTQELVNFLEHVKANSFPRDKAINTSVAAYVHAICARSHPRESQKVITASEMQ